MRPGRAKLGYGAPPRAPGRTTLDEPAVRLFDSSHMDKLLTYAVALLLIPLLWAAVFFTGDRVTSEEVEPAFRLECGRRLDEGSDERTGLIPSIRVVMAVDEEWRALVPGAVANEARRLLAASGSVFHGVGIHFLPVQIVPWESPDDVDTAEGLLAPARQSVATEGADIVVALTGQPTSGEEDGYAEVGGRYAVVVHHPDRPDLDALVMAHEISHLFGAHHGCDVASVGGMMADSGFADLHVVCPCTRRVLSENAHRFHELSDG